MSNPAFEADDFDVSEVMAELDMDFDAWVKEMLK